MSGRENFPILLGMDYELPGKIAKARLAGFREIVISVPWGLLAPHERQAVRNHGQSLVTLAGRGGLSACEALAVLEDREWRQMDFGTAHYRLATALREPGR
ncbi:MAG: hypothetical protein K5872_21975 [Rhizobiaceae bacterium]|nr:hypothetical protein [Rhizobiaceae bacterium]MCV0408888.1 hypothetical protein [Rhizobiaceae bacterium]